MPEIHQALNRLNAGHATDDDIDCLHRALQQGAITLSGDRCVTIRGNVSNVATLAGDVKGNVYFVTLTPSAYTALQGLAEPKPQPPDNPPTPTKTVPWPWLALDVVLAALVTVLGKVLGTHIEQQLSLPAVAALFTFVLVLLAVVTLFKSGTL